MLDIKHLVGGFRLIYFMYDRKHAYVSHRNEKGRVQSETEHNTCLATLLSHRCTNPIKMTSTSLFSQLEALRISITPAFKPAAQVIWECRDTAQFHEAYSTPTVSCAVVIPHQDYHEVLRRRIQSSNPS